MLILFLFFIIIVIVLLCIFIHKSKLMHKRFIESFQDEMDLNLSEDDKDKYFSIIDAYQLILDRDPNDNELNVSFNDMKTDKSKDVFYLTKNLQESDEFKNKNNIRRSNTNTTTEGKSPVVFDRHSKVMNILQEEMPLMETNYEVVWIEFLVMKYAEKMENKEAFINYLKKTPEYSDYVKFAEKETNKKGEDGKDGKDDVKLTKEVVITNNTEETKETTSLVDDKSNIEYKIGRPEINKTTLETIKIKTTDLLKSKPKTTDDNTVPVNENSCEFYNEFKIRGNELATLEQKRNMDKLKYHCELESLYTNVDKNMNLLANQTWNVPEKRTPICHSQNCTLNDSYSQTSLIGTLLDAVEIDSKILPSFQFKETE